MIVGAAGGVPGRPDTGRTTQRWPPFDRLRCWGHVGPAQFHTLTHPTPHLEAAALISEPVPDEAPAPKTPMPAPAEELEPAPTPTAAPPVAVAKTTRPASAPALPTALLDAARRIADTHRAEHGIPISAAHLGNRMGVALPVATTALAQL